MLPARRAALESALARIDARGSGELGREARITRLDGVVLDGVLREHGDRWVAIEDRSDALVYVANEEIRTLEVGERRAVREFVVVSGMIVGITALLALEWRIPFLRAHLSLPWLATQLAVFGFAGLMQLRRRTALGRWLRTWKPAYDVERPIPEIR